MALLRRLKQCSDWLQAHKSTNQVTCCFEATCRLKRPFLTVADSCRRRKYTCLFLSRIAWINWSNTHLTYFLPSLRDSKLTACIGAWERNAETGQFRANVVTLLFEKKMSKFNFSFRRSERRAFVSSPVLPLTCLFQLLTSAIRVSMTYSMFKCLSAGFKLFCSWSSRTL